MTDSDCDAICKCCQFSSSLTYAYAYTMSTKQRISNYKAYSELILVCLLMVKICDIMVCSACRFTLNKRLNQGDLHTCMCLHD